MQLRCNKDHLAAAVSKVQGALSEKSFARIGLRCSGDSLELVASDRIVSIYCQIPCTAEIPDTVFVPSRIFCDVIKELPSGIVTIACDGTQLTLSAGKEGSFQIKLPVIAEISWEEPPQLAFLPALSVKANQLKYMIDQIQFCISTDSQRNYGAVGYLHFTDKNSLRLVGTDGFRLSYCDVMVEDGKSSLPKGVCITKRALLELGKMCDESLQTGEAFDCRVSKDLTVVCASVGHYRIFIQLSAVRFPDYQGVIPKGKPLAISVPKANMQGIVKRVLLAADKTRVLNISFEKKLLTLTSRAMGTSEGREYVGIDKYTGPDGMFSVNGKYLADVLAIATSKDVEILFDGEEKPVMIIPQHEVGGFTSRHVLVPICEN